jgi:hypothetical protein
MSSSGEMKISLKLMICPALESARVRSRCWCAHILMSEMLEKLQFAVCALRQHRSAEGLHDLLDGHGLAGELILGRAAKSSVCDCISIAEADVPDETEGSHAYGLQVGVSLRRQFQALSQCGVLPHLLVISNVVPKIWARTNSAMVRGGYGGYATGAGWSV